MESLKVIDRLAKHLEMMELQDELVSDQLPGLLAGLALLETAIHQDVTAAKREALAAARRSGRLPLGREAADPGQRVRN